MCTYLLHRIASHHTTSKHHMQTRTRKIYKLQCLKRPSADKVLAYSQTVVFILVYVCHACAINRSKDILSAHNCDHISNGWQPQPFQLSITGSVLTCYSSSSSLSTTVVFFLQSSFVVVFEWASSHRLLL